MSDNCIWAERLTGVLLGTRACRISLNIGNILAHIIVELATAYRWVTADNFLRESVNLVWLERISREEVLGDSQKAKCV